MNPEDRGAALAPAPEMQWLAVLAGGRLAGAACGRRGLVPEGVEP
jgi:hypothetical protein